MNQHMQNLRNEKVLLEQLLQTAVGEEASLFLARIQQIRALLDDDPTQCRVA